ncbi:hypothetical protein [Euzebya tangerina]|uniref:hypothetical protein n=1 Tax=Euzebya tangerina TaxID=591198 RepID=UPI000E31CB47|nr:hypothetical protein [Euzebya tangerina]
MRRLHERDEGSYIMELLGFLPAFAIVAILAFQLAAIGGAAVAAENAARTGSRAASLGISPRNAAMSALDPDQRRYARVSGGLGGVTVVLDVPVVIPGIDLNVVTIRRSAHLPPRFGS